MTSRIGLFGGSFDPPHLGHLIAAELAADELGLDTVLWIPTGNSYHKSVGTSVEHRVEMVRLAIAGNDRFQVSRVDADRPGPTYTIDTVEALEHEVPGAEFTVILGDDSWNTIDSWHRSDELRARCQFAVIHRNGATRVPGPTSLRWIEIPAIGISSTACRERFRSGGTVRYWIPESVRGYIENNRLYTEDE